MTTTLPSSKDGGRGALKRQRLPSVSQDNSAEVEETHNDSGEISRETLVAYRKLLRSAATRKSVTLPNSDVLDCTHNDSGKSSRETLVVLSDDGDSDDDIPLAILFRSATRKSVTLPSSDVLDCPTCREPLKRPIFQCHNGHLACLSCCYKSKKRCSFCSLPIGDIRCRAMERVIKSSSVSCRNAIYGCKQSLRYGTTETRTHEKLCVFAPCSCPIQSCNYTGSYKDLKTHFRARHKRDNKDYFIPFVFERPVIFGLELSDNMMTIFQEEKEGDLVVVQGFRGSHGVYVTVSLIAPMSPEVRNLSCSLARLQEYSTLRLGLKVKRIQKVREPKQPEDGFMLIPSYMLSGDHLKMQICIGGEFEYTHI